ncbi:hypothetical protein VPH35_031256 [Triticum aestivum]
MASAKHSLKRSMAPADKEMPTSTPPPPLRASATDIAPVLATDTTSTFAGRPNPKSVSYTRNLGDPATVSGKSPAVYASMMRSIHPSQQPGPLRTTPSMAVAIAAHAVNRPSAPAAATSLLGAKAMHGPRQFPRYSSGTGGSSRVRWSAGKRK